MFVGIYKKHARILPTSMFCSTLNWICNILAACICNMVGVAEQLIRGDFNMTEAAEACTFGSKICFSL